MLLLYVGLIQNKAHPVACGQVAIMMVDKNEREAKCTQLQKFLQSVASIHIDVTSAKDCQIQSH
jgi:hypothetical protein